MATAILPKDSRGRASESFVYLFGTRRHLRLLDSLRRSILAQARSATAFHQHAAFVHRRRYIALFASLTVSLKTLSVSLARALAIQRIARFRCQVAQRLSPSTFGKRRRLGLRVL